MKTLLDILKSIDEPAPYLTYADKGQNNMNADYEDALNYLGISCSCKHSYHRHFDGFEASDSYVSCKYCSCSMFTGLLSTNVNSDRYDMHRVEWSSFVRQVDFFYKRPVHLILGDSLLEHYERIVSELKSAWTIDSKNQTLEEYMGLYELLWPINLTEERVKNIHLAYQYDASTYVYPTNDWDTDWEDGWGL